MILLSFAFWTSKFTKQDVYNSNSVLIISGTAILLFMGIGLIIFVIIYQQQQLKQKYEQQKAMQDLKSEMQRQMLESALEVQEVERVRIAKDLHDEVGAMLSVTKMSFNQLLRKLDSAEDLAKMGKQPVSCSNNQLVKYVEFPKNSYPARSKNLDSYFLLMNLSKKYIWLLLLLLLLVTKELPKNSVLIKN